MAPKPKADKKPAEKKPKVAAEKKNASKKHKKAVETYCFAGWRTVRRYLTQVCLALARSPQAGAPGHGHQLQGHVHHEQAWHFLLR